MGVRQGSARRSLQHEINTDCKINDVKRESPWVMVSVVHVVLCKKAQAETEIKLEDREGAVEDGELNIRRKGGFC